MMLWARNENSTMVENSQEYRLKYWATRSSVRSFARTTLSFACSGLLAPSAALTRSLARSLMGKAMIRWLFCLCFFLFSTIVQQSNFHSKRYMFYPLSFPARTKEKNPQKRAENQAGLSLLLEAASGFYFQLMQDVCAAFKLDVPFRSVHYGTKLGHIETSNHSLSHERGSERSERASERVSAAEGASEASSPEQANE